MRVMGAAGYDPARASLRPTSFQSWPVYQFRHAPIAVQGFCPSIGREFAAPSDRSGPRAILPRKPERQGAIGTRSGGGTVFLLYVMILRFGGRCIGRPTA